MFRFRRSPHDLARETNRQVFFATTNRGVERSEVKLGSGVVPVSARVVQQVRHLGRLHLGETHARKDEKHPQAGGICPQ